MDRFIDYPVPFLYFIVKYLKSNMDRFIAKKQVTIIVACGVFKIQYGQIYRIV